MRIPSGFGTAALVLCLAVPAAAWGRRGHALVATLALKDLPPELAPWFQDQVAVLRDHASDPDFWKTDPREGTRHFLEVEAYGGAAQVPVEVARAQAQLGPEAFRRAGQVVWVIQDRMRDLAQAFKDGDPGKAALQASFLSHYVGDLHVPLHTTRNYDGQARGQRGVHSRWETGLVDQLAGEPAIRPAVLEKGLFEAPWVWLRESNALAQAVLDDDLGADPSGPGAPRGAGRTTGYWLRFNQRQGPVVKEQLARAAQHTAQMILLAWTLAGRPAARVAAPASQGN